MVHLAKQGVKRISRDVKHVGRAVAFVADVALPTPIVSGLVVARLML